MTRSLTPLSLLLALFLGGCSLFNPIPGNPDEEEPAVLPDDDDDSAADDDDSTPDDDDATGDDDDSAEPEVPADDDDWRSPCIGVDAGPEDDQDWDCDGVDNGDGQPHLDYFWSDPHPGETATVRFRREVISCPDADPAFAGRGYGTNTDWQFHEDRQVERDGLFYPVEYDAVGLYLVTLRCEDESLVNGGWAMLHCDGADADPACCANPAGAHAYLIEVIEVPGGLVALPVTDEQICEDYHVLPEDE